MERLSLSDVIKASLLAGGLLSLGGCGDSSESESGIVDGPGRETWEENCQVCHQPGLAGAPKFGDESDWAPRIERGMDALYQSALEGTGEMPPRGGKPELSTEEVQQAVDFMVENSRPR